MLRRSRRTTAPKICPYCKNNLDAGEQCDCSRGKKNGSSQKEEPEESKRLASANASRSTGDYKYYL